jgi:hypothetical protein
MLNKLRNKLRSIFSKTPLKEAELEARECVEAGELDKLSKLMKDYPKLASAHFPEVFNKTLFIIACEHLQYDIVKYLLEQPKNQYFSKYLAHYSNYKDYYLQQRTDGGNRGVSYLLYRERGIDDHKGAIENHDVNALKILELIYRKQPDINKNGFTHKDKDGDTPLIEAVRAKLPKATKYLCTAFFDCDRSGDLFRALFEKNERKATAMTIAQSNGFFNDLMEVLASTPETAAEQVKLLAHVAEKATIKTKSGREYAGSPEHKAHKEKILSLIQERLAKVSREEVQALADVFFEKRLGTKFIELIKPYFWSTQEHEFLVNSWEEDMPPSFAVDHPKKEKPEILAITKENELLKYQDAVTEPFDDSLPPAYSDIIGNIPDLVASAAAGDRTR